MFKSCWFFFMSLMYSILREFLGHFTSSVPSEQTRNYHQVRIPFKLILSLIEIIMGPCPPFAPTQLEIPSGFLLHNEYFFLPSPAWTLSYVLTSAAACNPV